MTGPQVSAVALRAAGYLGDLAVVVPGKLGDDFEAASTALTAMANNEVECNTIALASNSLAIVIAQVWDWLRTNGYASAAEALGTVHR